MFQTKVVQEIKTCLFMFNIFFSRNSYRLWDSFIH